MELLERYLHAVGSNLLPKKRDDILRELRANILEAVEEREAALGRPLTLDEEESVLKEYGHPALVGMRYWPKQYLIGPSIFPYYLYALKTVLPLVVLLYCLVNAVALASQTVTSHRLSQALLGLPGAIFSAAAVITLLFVVVEYVQAHWPQKIDLFEKWSPRTLPQPPTSSVYSGRRTAVEVIASGLGLVWFVLIPYFPFLILGPGAQQLQYVTLAPEWTTFYWAFVTILFAQWMIELSGIFLPRLRPIRSLLGMLGRAATVAVFALMLRVPTYLWLSDAGRQAKNSQGLVDSLNLALGMGLRVIIAILVIQLLWDLVQMAIGGRPSSTGLTFNGPVQGK